MQPSFNPVFNSLVYSPYSKRGYFPGSGSLTDTQLLAAIDPDQMLLIDSTPHYTTAEWSGFEHLLKDQKPTVGTLRTPRAGRCWLRDSTDDYLNRNDSNLKPTGDFTICMWIKVADWNVSDKGLAGAWGGAGFMLYMSGGTLRLYRGTNFVSSSLTLHGAGYNNTWIHLTAVASGTTCTFYVNGSQFGATGTWPVSTQTQVAGPFEVGTYQSSTYGHIAASMRDVRLYGVAKNSTEIAAIFNQASTPGTYDTTNLLGAWWCEEESGTTGYDWSGNGRHLTLTNITQSTFHASDTGVTYSDANVRGARQWKTISYTSGGSSWADGVTFLSGIELTGTIEIEIGGFFGGAVPVCGMQSESTKTATHNYINVDCGVQYQNSTTLRVWVNGTATDHTVSSYDSTAIAKIVRSGTTASIYLNGVLVTTQTVSSGTMYAVSTFLVGGAAQTIRMLYNSGINMEQDNAGVGSNLTSGMFIMPAVSSTIAADGNALTHTGKCPQPGYAPQRVATFDGTDDYAEETSTHAMSGLSDFTFCAWVYMTAAGNFPMLLSNGGSSYSLDIRFQINSRKLEAGSADSTGASGNVVASTAISLNTWTFISVTYTASIRTLRLYINASLDNSGALVAGSGGSPNNITISGPTRIGARFDGHYFQGRLADVRVYNVVKTVGELSTIMTGGIDATGIVRHWPMCEGPGTGNTNTTIYDVSGNGKHLTITNATVSSFWANSTALPCTVANYPLRYGYTVNGSGVIVPALISGSTDAAGNAIGQAAGGWVSGLQNLNCLPYTNPLGVSVGLETSLDPTADRKTTSSSKRRRRNTSGRYDRFGARSTAMSDASSNAYFGD